LLSEQYRKESSYLDPQGELEVQSNTPISLSATFPKVSLTNHPDEEIVENSISRRSSLSKSSSSSEDEDDHDGEETISQGKSSSSSVESLIEVVKKMAPIMANPDRKTQYSSDSESSTIQHKVSSIPNPQDSDNESTDTEATSIKDRNLTTEIPLESPRSSYSNTSEDEKEEEKPINDVNNSLFARVKSVFSFRLRGDEVKPQGTEKAQSESEDESGPAPTQLEPQGQNRTESSSSSDEESDGNEFVSPIIPRKFSLSSNSENEVEIKEAIKLTEVDTNKNVDQEKRNDSPISSSSSSSEDEEPNASKRTIYKSYKSSSSLSSSDNEERINESKDQPHLNRLLNGESVEIPDSKVAMKKSSSSSSGSEASLPKYFPRKSSFSPSSDEDNKKMHALDGIEILYYDLLPNASSPKPVRQMQVCLIKFANHASLPTNRTKACFPSLIPLPSPAG